MEVLLYLSLGDLIGVGGPTRRHQLRHPVHRALLYPWAGSPPLQTHGVCRPLLHSLQVCPPLHKFHVILCKPLENKNVTFLSQYYK